MPIVRTVVRFLIAGFLAVAVAGVAWSALAAPVALAVPAAAKAGQDLQSPATIGAVGSGLTVSIASVTPQFASANSVVQVRGTITNDTGKPLEGVQVFLETSATWFTSRTQMGEFSKGGTYPLYAVTGSEWNAPATLHGHATMSWTASYHVASQGYTAYEVYPIEAQALSDRYAQLGEARTFLPYWPSSGSAAPDKLNISWIWPLMDAPQQDVPQQGTCSRDLATSDLAASLAPGGRLNGLLAAGLRYADQHQPHLGGRSGACFPTPRS